ncbi:MAG TPA: sulfotransferase family protein [Streptosporangiaceae bacterium]|nr:sulfotransferase family protein [Streptosporangiaceae bacterium]
MRHRLIAMWSAPRCRSTAFSRMMIERGDFLVVHEPFSHLMDFGETTIHGSQVRSERELIDALYKLSDSHNVFFKDTTDFHYPGLIADTSFLRDATHTFMIRDPRAAIASHYRLNPGLTCAEVGFARLREIYDSVTAASGRTAVVLDSDDLVADPAGLIAEYCRRTGIPFLPEALSWSPGMVDQWQRTSRWHVTASASKAFVGDRQSESPELDQCSRLRDYLDHHLPHYQALWARRLVRPTART